MDDAKRQTGKMKNDAVTQMMRSIFGRAGGGGGCFMLLYLFTDVPEAIYTKVLCSCIRGRRLANVFGPR
jgi:hypothetical protein